MKPLTLKGILKKHKQSLPLLRKGKQNPKDKELHKDIETKEVKKMILISKA